MPQSNRFPFSETRIRDFPAPSRGRVYVHDTQTPHLQMCVTNNGVRTFYYGRRISGRPVRVRLGLVGELNVKQARDAAHRLSGEVADGKDPYLDRKLTRTAPTLGELWQWWEQWMVPQKKTGKRDRWYWERYLEAWKHRRLASIETRDIAQLHTQIGQNNGKYTANRVLNILKAMYGKAESVGFEGKNPCKGVKPFPEQERDRFLNRDELRTFLTALSQESDPWRDFFMICLLTGARKGNVLAMRWQDIDLDHNYWRLAENKSGKPVVVPLVASAAEILHKRKSRANGSPWVFPSRSETGHIVDPSRKFDEIKQRTGLKDVRIHDLRRTLGSWQAIEGASLLIIGKSLGHRSTSATQIYARLSMEPVRESVERATQKMLEVTQEEGRGE